MSEYITTHEELLKLHGAKVTCEINSCEIDDAKICVENDEVFVCQNKKNGWSARDKLGYKYSWTISSNDDKYETGGSCCKNIRLVKTTADVIKELDKRLDDLTPGVILEATKTWDAFTKVWNELYHKAERIKSNSTLEKFTRKIKELV